MQSSLRQRAPAAPLLYLGPEAVAACGLRAGDITSAVEATFRSKAAGLARTGERLAMLAGEQANFCAKGGVLEEEGFAVVKWYGYLPHNQDRNGLPDFSPLLILSSIATGLPLAVIDGHWLSATRTAALSCVAARVLAKPEAATVGFVACGAQAHSHLEALADEFPLKRIVAYSRSTASAEKLARHARDLGLEAQVTTRPHEAVENLDIVVSSVPRRSQPQGFLAALRVAPGAFVAMACMGYSWDPQQLRAFDVLATDDYDQVTRRSSEKLNYDGQFDVDLASLVTNVARSHTSRLTRSALLFAGSGLADAAAAAAIYRRALEVGAGQQLAASSSQQPMHAAQCGAPT